jgi:hypothetical protein
VPGIRAALAAGRAAGERREGSATRDHEPGGALLSQARSAPNGCSLQSRGSIATALPAIAAAVALADFAKLVPVEAGPAQIPAVVAGAPAFAAVSAAVALADLAALVLEEIALPPL